MADSIAASGREPAHPDAFSSDYTKKGIGASWAEKERAGSFEAARPEFRLRRR
jgi:hypothetical protein